jgi:hypothetical protein
MPIISTFFGIVVRMYFDDHGPPHIHVAYRWSSTGVWTIGPSWNRIGPRPRACGRWSAFPELTMIKLTAIEQKEGTSLLLRFSDGAWGVFDFARYLKAGTEMTAPLCDHHFFSRHFIEAGALAWPNGFDLSADSLYGKLQAAGKLRFDSKAA